jgi:hypothetical protein
VTDILDLIDAVTATVCGWCQQPLPTGGVSEFWCDDECQYEWERLRGEALVGYREPTDLAVHVGNLEELASPETTPPRPDYGRPASAALCAIFERMRVAAEAEVEWRLLYGTPFTFAWENEFPMVAMQGRPLSFEGVIDYVRPSPAPTVEIFPWRVIPLPDAADLPEPLPPLPEVVHTSSFFYNQHGDPATAPVETPVVRVEQLGSSGIPAQYTEPNAGLPRRQRAPRTIRPRGCT